MPSINLPGIVLFIAVPSIVLGLWGAAIARVSWRAAEAISWALNTVLLAWVIGNDHGSARGGEVDPAIIYVGGCVILILTAALAARIYRAAILGDVTEQERQPGWPGVRAWLPVRNVLAIIAIAVAAQLAFDYSFIGVAFVGLCVLLAFPVGNMAIRANTTTSSAPQPPAAERQRVLALVEAGKVSAEDAAELLSALAQSQSADQRTPVQLSGPRRIMAIGAAVMLIAFFLPWFSENLTRAMSAMQQTLPNFSLPGGMTLSSTPGSEVLPDSGGQTPVQKSDLQVSLRGGDVRNGLGWIALVAAIAAAALPLFWPSRPRDDRPMRNLTLAILAVGSIALLYLLSNAFNAITTIEPGFLLALAGYAVLWIGAVREYAVHKTQLQPAMEA